ncbi:MAG: hypothetical protein PHE55_23025, partial [Methylococcaceae bacterium]|nr:hypothetical protein [Methylococcaceae bacterium]
LGALAMLNVSPLAMTRHDKNSTSSVWENSVKVAKFNIIARLRATIMAHILPPITSIPPLGLWTG